MYPFQFTREEIEAAAREVRLLALEIEIGAGCSPRCPHCHVPKRATPGEALSDEESFDLILQAKDLGARRISVLDGAAEVHRRLSPIVRFARSEGLEVEVLTSGAGIAEDVARELFESRVPVVLRMDSLDEATQDALTGSEGSFQLMQQAFRKLREAGYPSPEAALQVDTLICQRNLDGIVDIWRGLRAEGILPRFEVAAPRAKSSEKRWLQVDPGRVQEVLAEIARIEREEYGLEWDLPPPRWGNGCMQHKVSCLVRWQGDVLPCVGVDISIGNIRNRSLAEIVQESEILEDLRDHGRTIKGPCAFCEETVTCYGCRGAAYQWTGDYLASDPCCWRNADRQDRIHGLPIKADGIVPQEPPMRIVDAVVEVGERSGAISMVVSDRMPFVGEDGALDEAAYFELIAQSIAALHGFKQLGGTQEPSGGYLVGAQNLEILGPARIGDQLTIAVYKDLRFGGFGIFKGTISRNDAVLARGEIKIWSEAENVPPIADTAE